MHCSNNALLSLSTIFPGTGIKIEDRLSISSKLLPSAILRFTYITAASANSSRGVVRNFPEEQTVFQIHPNLSASQAALTVYLKNESVHGEEW